MTGLGCWYVNTEGIKRYRRRLDPADMGGGRGAFSRWNSSDTPTLNSQSGASAWAGVVSNYSSTD